MPDLLSLSIELVTSTFRKLACVELRRTLTVSHAWHTIAKTVCYEDITLDFSAGNASADAQRTGIQRVPILRLKFLTLLLTPSPNQGADDVVFSALYCLADIVKEAKTLTHFRLHNTLDPQIDASDLHYDRWTPTRLAHPLVKVLTSISTLQTLHSVEIDMMDASWKDGLEGTAHLCPMMSGLLLRIARCRFRLPMLCEEIFACPSAADSSSHSRNIIINLSHSIGDIQITARKSTRNCQVLNHGAIGTKALQPSVIIVAAQQALSRMPDIQNLRVIWHEYSSLDVYAHDCVTGRRAQISGHDWDEWGEDLSEFAETSDDGPFGSDDSFFSDTESD